jgi:DNA helicase-2/ATP-dependent DNA helicase PcrA
MRWETADATLIGRFIGLCKARMARPHSTQAMEIATVLQNQFGVAKAGVAKLNTAYEIAEDLRCDRQLLTFDDMLCYCVALFQRDEQARIRWASQYDYVIQDEAQDQNPVQLLLGEMFAKDHRNYMLVGDPAQAIYGFRGAVPDMLLSFEQRWGARVIRMGRNYRSGAAILNAANLSLAQMDPSTHLGIEMLCERGTDGHVDSRVYTDQDTEGEHVAEQIAALLADGTSPSDIAILYRVNAQSRAPEEALIGRRIPYRVVGGTNFYQRKEVADLLAYLRLGAGTGTFSDVKRCLNTPNRYLGKAFLSAVEETAANNRRLSWPDAVRATCRTARVNRRQENAAHEWADVIEGIAESIAKGDENALPARLLDTIVMETSYTDWLVRDEGEESVENSRVSNVRELIRAAGRFTSAKDLLGYIDEVIAASKVRSDDKPLVTLTTIHRAKGLEWGSVYFVGVNEKVLPHARAEDIGEEHRLFYVGVTRARDNLHVSCVQQIAVGAKVIFVEPSRFASGIGMFAQEEPPQAP